MVSASSPGKVLICGGYLVVEGPNIGLSLGVTARFTTKVTQDVKGDEGSSLLRIIVQSPQFGSSFAFEVSYDPSSASIAVQQTSGSSSPFLYYGILYSAASVVLLRGGWETLQGRSVTLVLLASNDFYSQRNYLEQIGEPVTTEALRRVPPHQPLVGEVSKTGLGSSAAMTSSFVACLHRLFVGETIDVERIHRVAQVAHSVAQGKIGSGFDVYTAIYGTSIYTRFPAAKASVMMASEPPKTVDTAVLAQCIDSSQTWVTPTAFHRLPRGLTMMLADIHQGGSSTPGMVASIFNWRKSVQGVPDNLWDRLGAANVAYVELLKALQQQASDRPEEHDAAVAQLGQMVLSDDKATTDGAAGLWWKAREAAGTCRRLLRDVGNAAAVKVEPSELTPLLDATLQLPGVLAAGCPGAGGYDAIFALVLGDGSGAVEKFWEEYSGLHVCPLLVREDPAGLTFD